VTQPDLAREALVLATLIAAALAAIVVSGADVSVLAAVPALAVAGLAVVPMLPPALRRRRLELAAVTLPLGMLVLAVAVVSVAALGIPLTRVSLLMTLAALVAAGALAQRRSADRPLADGGRAQPGAAERPLHDDVPAQPGAAERPLADGGQAQPGAADRPVGGASATPRGADLPTPVAAAILVACLTLAALLAVRASGGTPPSGNDWGKYLLYADEIRRQGSLLIDNPYWLLGVPFREDPAGPAVLGSLLILSGGATAELAWAIVGCVLLGLLATFAAVSTLFGRRAACAAVAVLAVAPAQADMAAWHGLANFVGLAFLPLALLAVGLVLRGDRSWSACGLLALTLVGIAAAHRLTLLVTVVTLAGIGVVALARAPGVMLRIAARLAAAAAVLGALVASDLLRRSADDGGVQSYSAYLDTKIVWSLVQRDLSWALVVLAAISVLVVVRWAREPIAWLGIALLGAALAYGYSWIAHVPGFYIRAVYFMPLAVAFLVAAAAWLAQRRGGRAARLVPAVIAVAALAAAPAAWGVAGDVRNYYGWTDDAALRGYDLVVRGLGPGQTVVTDRCTSFLAPWLVHAPVLAGLLPSDIGPAAERARVAEARAVLAGGAAGRRVVARRRVRFVLINPRCPGTEQRVPSGGSLVFASTHLTVFATGSP